MSGKPASGLALLWAADSPAAAKPRLGLSPARIVDAAIEIADARGLHAVSMSQVAQSLGFTTMALYRHIASKDDLIALMADTAVGQPSGLDSVSDGWRAALERWSLALLATLRLHPWVLDVPITAPPVRPSQLAWLDRGLHALSDTTLSEADKSATILLLNGFVFWEARLAADLGPAESTPVNAPPDLDLSALIDAHRFPALRRAVDAGIFDEQSRHDDLEFGLAMILDGLEQAMTARPDRPSKTASQPVVGRPPEAAP